jgi:hypothetical protein
VACGVGGCAAGPWNLWGYRADLAGCCDAGVEHAVHYDGMMMDGGEVIEDGEVIEGPMMYGPTPATLPTPPTEGEAGPNDLPTPPTEFPHPARNTGAPKTRSALKKIDGRPTAHYIRRPMPATTMR